MDALNKFRAQRDNRELVLKEKSETDNTIPTNFKTYHGAMHRFDYSLFMYLVIIQIILLKKNTYYYLRVEHSLG